MAYNKNDNTWTYYDNDEFSVNKRCRLISEAYTMYDLKIIELDSFKGVLTLLTSDEDNAIIGKLAIKKYKRSKQWSLYRKLNRRLPFSRSSKAAGLNNDNVCDTCKLRHESIDRHKSNYCPNEKNHMSVHGSSFDKLYHLISTYPNDELMIATARSIQRMLYINGNKIL